MIRITFLLIAFLTIFFSVRLSILADKIKNKTKISNALAGGFLLAFITALPELITSLSSVRLGNPSLAIGNTLGSIFFNIQILMIINIIYFRKRMFCKISHRYVRIMILFVISFIIVYFSVSDRFTHQLGHISISSIVIFVVYTMYLRLSSCLDIEEENEEVPERKRYLYIKFIVTGALIIFLSYTLTQVTNQITILYPQVGSSAVGAFLLGVTTSLPEVVSVVTLLSIRNYDMALFNIIGSVFLNFIILSLVDMTFTDTSIYVITQFDDLVMIKLASISGLMLAYQVVIKSQKSHLMNLIPSLISVLCYLALWINFFML